MQGAGHPSGSIWTGLPRSANPIGGPSLIDLRLHARITLTVGLARGTYSDVASPAVIWILGLGTCRGPGESYWSSMTSLPGCEIVVFSVMSLPLLLT